MLFSHILAILLDIQFFGRAQEPKMEGEGDEGTKHTQVPSTSTKYLPQELITAILVRLPVKYLLQYKSVSKDWLSLISSPEFVKTHLSFSANDYTRHSVMLEEQKYPPLEYNEHGLKHCSVSSLFNESVTQAFDLDYPLKNLNSSVDLTGSINGLICVRIGFDRVFVLVVWNPSTRKFKQVPTSIFTRLSDYGDNYGFGYDEVHDDYKIVGLLDSIKNGYVFGEIYSLKNDSWRSLDDFQAGKLTHSGTTLVNGKLHWVTDGGDGFDIVSVDLVDEKCRKVEQLCYGEGIIGLKLGVLGSDFSVLCNYHRDCQITHTDVWAMKEDGVKESWTKLYTIKYPIDGGGVCEPICMSNKGEVLLLYKFELAIYNPEDKSFKFPKTTNVDDILEAELYIESLVCPNL